jgi:hypothetical protein
LPLTNEHHHPPFRAATYRARLVEECGDFRPTWKNEAPKLRQRTLHFPPPSLQLLDSNRREATCPPAGTCNVSPSAEEGPLYGEEWGAEDLRKYRIRQDDPNDGIELVD